MNEDCSQLYCSPAAVAEREEYWRKHSTEIALLMCMDGRVNPKITRTPPGIIHPFRNVGGQFDLGWPMFQDKVESFKLYCRKRNRQSLVGVTYHYSRGDKKRGCGGFRENTNAAIAFMRNLKAQFVYDFHQSSNFYTMLCGVETDLESMVLHGENGERVDMADTEDPTERTLLPMLHWLYPDMSERMTQDLLHLVQGNVMHIAGVRASHRPPIALKHGEWILCIGRGFGWIDDINKAIIIGPYTPDLPHPIVVAGKILLKNIREGRTPVDNGNKIVLHASAQYDEAGDRRRSAERKARYLADLAFETLRDRVPDLMKHVVRLTATEDMQTRRINVLERD